jgi:hypothetical protein
MAPPHVYFLSPKIEIENKNLKYPINPKDQKSTHTKPILSTNLQTNPIPKGARTRMAPPHAWILNPEIEIENKNSRIQSTLKTRNQLILNLSYQLTYKLTSSPRVLGPEWPLPMLTF